MIDFHSHILPGIDDGSKNFNETLALIEEAKKAGFTKIISTSHYIDGYYECNEEERTKLIDQIKENVQGIGIYLGNEIYLTENIVKLIEDKKASSMNNTRYVLFELPMNNKPMNVQEVVYILLENGYIPIIAHPERYSFVQDDINFALNLSDMGVLFQSNYGSAIGMYGKKAQKLQKQLLKLGVIQFLGTDVHKLGQVYEKMPKILKKLEKIISTEELRELTTTNPQKVLDNENIEQ